MAEPSPLDTRLEREERERHAHGLLTEGEQARAQLRAYTRYRTDAWAFLTDCVWTQDQTDSRNPIKPYPGHHEYLRFFVQCWLKYPHIAVPKSRRMVMSWSNIPLYLWDTLFHTGRANAFVSKKEDDSRELVERAEFVYGKIPEWRVPRALLPKIKNGKMSQQPPAMIFEETHSKIQGFPMGANQLRQFTFSGIFGDECAFWEEAEEFYAGARPTIEGGGRMTLVSSRSPGFFKKICYDRVDAPDYNFPEIPPAPTKTPIPGIEVWKNPRNGFLVIDLDFTANPAKRGKEWYTTVRQSMPLRQFQREYEKSWQTFEGLPVYGDFSRSAHATPDALEGEAGAPLLLGWDFGLTPACVIAQLNNGRLMLLKEFVSTNESLKTFAPKVWQWIAREYPDHSRQHKMLMNYIDPAGFQRAQTDSKTCAGILRDTGFTDITPGPIDFESRKGAVEHFLLRHTKAGPALQLSERGCPTLLEGFTGGYQYPEKADENEPTKLRPKKNSWSHCHDALQYLAAGCLAHTRGASPDIPTPHYGFLSEAAHEEGA